MIYPKTKKIAVIRITLCRCYVVQLRSVLGINLLSLRHQKAKMMTQLTDVILSDTLPQQHKLQQTSQGPPPEPTLRRPEISAVTR